MTHPISHGYKPSLLGPIPQDWEVLELGEICKTISSGKSKTLDEGGKYPIYGSTGIIGYSKTLDYQGKSILVARVGANAGTVNYVEGEYAVSDNTLMVQLKEGSSLFRYIYYSLVGYKLNKLVFGSGQPLITGGQLKSLKLPLPPLPEQKAIASILSTCDETITKTQQLIDKLERRHKVLCQQLLTGKKRVAGFSGEWKEEKIGNQIEFYEESTKSENEYPVLTSSNKGLMLQSEYYGGRIVDKSNIGFNVVPYNYITYRSRSDTGDFTFNLNLIGKGIVSMYYPVFKSKFNQNYFMCQLLNFYKHKLGRYSLGTSQLVLSHTELKKIKLKFPSAEEQERISSHLQSSENQISLLKQKLKFLKKLKKGLMQQLLTGKTRVPQSYLTE